MERTRQAINQHQYPIMEEPLSISKYLMDTLMKDKQNFANMFVLYCFYYYTAKWQGTMQPKATTDYTATGIGWGRGKVIEVKNKLKELGLIEDVVQRDAKGQVAGYYIRITTLLVFPGVVRTDINALRTNKRKILISPSTLSKNINTSPITPSLFDTFWKLYPTKSGKGAALSAWNNLCTAQSKKKFKPTWQKVIISIKKQKMSERWQANIIPNASTWLNQYRWFDDPKEMKAFTRENNKFKEPYKEWEGRRYYLCPDGEYRNKAGAIWTD